MKNNNLLYSLSSFLLLFANLVFASDVAIIPSLTDVRLGDLINASIIVNTKGKSINNAEGIINYPKDLIEVVSISKTGSIFSFWMEEPKFSNSVGKISFNGGVPNPGFTGSNGLIAKISFKAKKSGSATISFLTANVRLNDGLGTDDTDGKISATVNIKEATTNIVPVINNPVVNSPIPITNQIEDLNNLDPLPPVNVEREIPDILSDDAPDENAWYSQSKITFYWEIPNGINGIQLLYGKKANSVPSISYIPPIGKKTIDELNDGTYYFHARFRDIYGWGQTVHRKINIDKTKPQNLDISYKVNDNDLIELDIFAEDSLSGIKKYSVALNEEEIEINVSSPTEKGKTILPPLKKGKQDILVKAYDLAGNVLEKKIEVDAPEVKIPKIVSYPEKINTKEKHNISGNAYYDNAIVEFWFNDKKVHEVATKEDGTFNCECSMENCADLMKFVSDLSKANESQNIDLNVKIKTVRAKGVESDFSKDVKIVLNKTSFPKLNISFSKINNINNVIIGLFILIFIILGFIYFDLKKVKTTKRVLNRDLAQTETEVKRILEVIQNEIRNSQKLLKKAGSKRQQALGLANKEEYKILDQLAKNIDIAEKYFSDKMKNMTDRD